MVKKLYKHEIFALSRVLLIVYAILLAVSLMGRFIQFFENDTLSYQIISGSSFFVYGLAILACIAFTTIFGVVRFYKNLFTGEGYLSLTLPVSTTTHIWVKLLTAVLFDIFSAITVLLSVIIITSGEVLKELFLAGKYIFNNLPDQLSANLPAYILEVLLLIIISCISKYLVFYTCISIGQLFRKNRILAAVGAYFVYYIIGQVLSTIMMIVYTILSEMGALDPMYDFLDKYPYKSAHIVLISSIVFYLIGVLIFYMITQHIMRKRLNLE